MVVCFCCFVILMSMYSIPRTSRGLKMLPRYDWFQTDDAVTISILRKGVELADCVVSYNDKQVTVKVKDEVIFSERLSHQVDKDNMTVKCAQARVEVRMPKVSGGRWDRLVEDLPPSSSTPFESKKWDKLEKEVSKEEEEESLEGDAAVNRLFKKIYADASDDVKKAMMKSYQESNGTVLSTNWAEISAKKTEVRPPDCMEYKKFDQ